MEKQLSVIIPVYNGEKYIDSCILTLNNQIYKNIEIIMVDDGSTDNTAKLLDEYSKKDDRIVVIHQKNQGVSKARNEGVKRATGKYIWFLDIDDEVSENLISDNLKLAIDNDADVVMFCFSYYNPDNNKTKINEMQKLFVGSKEDFFRKQLIETLNNEVFNPPWNKIIKRSILIENNLHFNCDFSIYEDLAFAPCLMSAANKVVVNNKMYYKYIIKSSGSLITKFFDNFFEAVTDFHINAIKYCDKFENNFQQKQRMNEVYVKLVISHIKQISCNKELDKMQKIELLDKICQNDRFIFAIKNVNIKDKRKYIKRLILNKKYTTLVNLYRLINKLQGNVI